MASWLSSVITQKAPIMSLTKFPLLVLHTEPSTSARPQTTGHCIKRKCSTYDANSINGYPPPLFQQSQHTIWPPWRNARTPLTTEMVKSTRTWTQPTKATLTSSVIAPLKTMWSIELSDDEDNSLARTSQALQMTSLHLFWMQITMMTTMGMTHSHVKIKIMENLWKLLNNLTHLTQWYKA